MSEKLVGGTAPTHFVNPAIVHTQAASLPTTSSAIMRCAPAAREINDITARPKGVCERKRVLLEQNDEMDTEARRMRATYLDHSHIARAQSWSFRR